jgi:hypothetical protein
MSSSYSTTRRLNSTEISLSGPRATDSILLWQHFLLTFPRGSWSEVPSLHLCIVTLLAQPYHPVRSHFPFVLRFNDSLFGMDMLPDPLVHFRTE